MRNLGEWHLCRRVQMLSEESEEDYDAEGVYEHSCWDEVGR